MQEKLQKLQTQLMEWWNRFQPKQKTMIVSVAAGVVFLFVLLGTVLSKPQYELLHTSETTKETSEIVEFLKAGEITHTVSDDGLVIDVLSDQLSDARMVLGANDIRSDAYSLDAALNGTMSTTESDKQKKYKLYTEGQLEEDLEANDYVKEASVRLMIPEEDGTLLSKNEESHAAVVLDIHGEMPADVPYSIAMFIKTAIGNQTTENIMIMDTTGATLYAGEDTRTITGSATNQMETKQQTEAIISNDLKKLLMNTEQFTKVEIDPNLSFNWDNVKEVSSNYTAPDGRTEGMKITEDIYSSASSGGEGSVPGTDSNDDGGPSYVYQDGSSSEQEVNESHITYSPDSVIKEKITLPGTVELEKSSVGVTTIKYNIVNEEEIKEQGLLDGITWEEYKVTNDLETTVEVEEGIYELVANATGFSSDSISIVSVEKPLFFDAEGLAISPSDIGIIILVILVIALLLFVVFSGMRKEKGVDEETELSVESLLQSTPGEVLGDIELGDKSEKRRIIEAFVDANPEAVANLLCNWLNDEWASGKGKNDEGKLNGNQKSAILLIVLGPEHSSEIFKHLKEEEIEELTLEIANTRSITPQMKEIVIDEFYEVCLAQQYIAEGGIGYAKELLEKALGKSKADEVIGKLTASLQVRPFEFIRKTDATQIMNFIQDEHPQTIALILAYLTPTQASQIISSLPLDRQSDVTKRIALMDRTSPDVIKEVERVLESKLSSLVNQDYAIIGGVDQVVEMLNLVDRGTEKYIMENLEIEEPELADEIRKKMFIFEDILLLDDRAIQRVLRDVDNSDLGLALKGSSEQVQNSIFNNLSKRLATMIKEDMDFMGPVRMKDVEEAQQKIVNIIRKLEESSEIVISRGGGDEIIV